MTSPGSVWIDLDQVYGGGGRGNCGVGDPAVRVGESISSARFAVGQTIGKRAAMASVRPNRLAIREGIGKRALELGFKRKSDRLYEREEGDLTFWLRFTMSDDERFVDLAGVVSRELDEMIAATGADLNPYNIDEPSKGHVYISAIDAWRAQSRASEEAFRKPLRWLGPIYWFLPWINIWRRRDPFTQSPFVEKGRWYAGADPEGCAAASLAKWREIVEPWLDAMQDPRLFARWYSNNQWAYVLTPARAVAFARAGDVAMATWLLQSDFDARNWTEADAIKHFRRGPRSSWHFKTDEEQRAAALDSVELAQFRSARARRVADALGLTLRE